MTFAKDIGLGKQLDRSFSHLKLRRRLYSVSAKVMSFLQMVIKGGDRLLDIDVLRADPGLPRSFTDGASSPAEHAGRFEPAVSNEGCSSAGGVWNAGCSGGASGEENVAGNPRH